ncbi:enoyl-CoA hydratase/isomerase family protein [Occultella glacieicola]|uniref:Enoyl-CoA hydratase/isomerase family protein n=1 Tax=Occultella glacieicola TaxID=2518684 RepID=A0ABY2DYD0_9MICO|nr:enoyl-CoA hydratase/isomerase family protein [Occultella glacieicola]TDE89488.1 enoyl-CoA hydratase/isomerase family protein [Occultella glacieicola]
MTGTPDHGTAAISFDDSGEVATITLDRAAKLNALTPAMLRDLERVAREADDSPARLVLVRTAGTRVFCVGADITMFGALGGVEMWRDWISVGHRAFSALEAIRCPTIAVIDGLAFGGGLELALACDFRIMADGARLALPETGLGTVPGWGGTGRLPALVGPSRAKEMILARREVAADAALAWGLVNEVAAPSALPECVQRWSTRIRGGAPVAVALAKQLVTATLEGAPASVVEALAGGLSVGTDDLAEGVAAFGEKRTPEFSGR